MEYILMDLSGLLVFEEYVKWILNESIKITNYKLGMDNYFYSGGGRMGSLLREIKKIKNRFDWMYFINTAKDIKEPG
jgi:hypothetical protein